MGLSALRFFSIVFALSCLGITTISFAEKCERSGICSQKCDVVGGVTSCLCMEGFQKMSTNSCVPTDPYWRIIYAAGDDVLSINVPTREHTNVITPSKNGPLYVTSDARNENVYWTSSPLKAVYKSNARRYTQTDVVVDVGTYKPEGIAFDWITGNLYFVDAKLSFIAVCAQNQTRCSVVLPEGESRPADIALHPNEGIMFWTINDNNGYIMKAEMNGNGPTTIVSTGLFKPYSITVDEGNSRIYWAHGKSWKERIESSQFDGSDRQTITSSENPFGLGILGDLIFWSDWNNNTIRSANKFTGERETGSNALFSVNTRPCGISLMHIARQPKLGKNPCENFGCSHICALSVYGAQCLCPAGMVKNGFTCVDDDNAPKLLLAQNGRLFSMPVNIIGKDVFHETPLPSQIKDINTLVYNPIDKSLIISDIKSRKIVKYHLKRRHYAVLVEGDISNVTSMDVDVVSENLFWVDAGKKTIEVLSLRTLARAVVRSNVTSCHDIAFIAHLGTLYLSKTSDIEGEEIHQINFGKESADTLIYKYSDAIRAEPAIMTYDKDTGMILAASGDGSYVNVLHNSTTGFQLHKVVSSHLFVPHVSSIVKIRNQIFYAHQYGGINVITADLAGNPNVSEHAIIKTNFDATHQSSFRKLLTSTNADTGQHVEKLRNEHDCSPKNPNRKMCSHICLPNGINLLGDCWCPTDFNLSGDHLTCIKSVESEKESTQLSKVTTSVNIAVSGQSNFSKADDKKTENKYEVSSKTSTTAATVEDNKATRINWQIFGYVVLFIINVVFGGAIVFLVVYWIKTRSIPLLTKPRFYNPT